MSNFLTVKQMVSNTVKDAEGNDQQVEAELTFMIPYATVSFTVTDESTSTMRVVMMDGTTHLLGGSDTVTFNQEYPAFLNK